MRKSIITILVASSVVIMIQCETTNNKKTSVDKNKVGFVQAIYNANGEKVGTTQKVDDKTTKTEYDFNQNGIAEKIVVNEGDVLKYVIYDKDQDGKSDQWVNYENGKPSKVDNFDKDGTRKSVTEFDENGQIKFVDLLKKGKRVYYLDGKIDKIENLETETENIKTEEK